MEGWGRVHDRAILDALEDIEPIQFDGEVWRITRAGANATKGSAASGRWSPGGSIEVLYNSVEKAGALAEIGYRLSLEPVWPSKIAHEIHSISARTDRVLKFADVGSLSPLGVDPSRYESFDYAATQSVAAAAHFLEFDGLLVPSARHPCSNLVLFMDRGDPGNLTINSSEPVDWADWRSKRVQAMRVRSG